MHTTEKLAKILREAGYSVTEPRVAVFECLRAIAEPISTTELAKTISTIDRVSVYRTVELFEKIGIIHRVWTGFKSKVELSDAFSPHHHHFTCLKCGKTVGLKSDKLEEALHEFEAQHGFNLTHHSVELSGYCSSCSDLHV